MKRDWSLIRQLLLLIERQGGREVMNTDFLQDNVAWYQIDLLQEAGFVVEESVRPFGSPRHLLSIHLTWEGQEFLALIKPERLWREVCSLAEQKELPLSLSVIRQVAERLVEGRLSGEAVAEAG